MKYKLIILLLGFALQLFAQKGKIVLEEPAKYKVPIEGILLNQATDVIKGTTWQLASDRDNNPTFDKAGGTTVMKKLSFLEGDLYAMEEQGNYLHIYKDPKMSFTGELSEAAVDFGWISKDKLLLWKHCLVTPKGEINKKAMVLNTVASIKSNSTSGDGKMIQFFKDPAMTLESENESQLFQVFFVYKIDIVNNSVLLGKSSVIRHQEYLKDNIVGWVPKDRVTSWDHRIAVEPNWLPEAVNERKGRNMKAMVFRTESDARVYNVSRAFWDADPYEDRNIGDWRRFPVLDNNNGIIHTGVMGEINSVKGVKLTSEENAEIQRSYNEIRSSKRHINVVFLLNSAHEEMENACEAVEEFLDDIEDKLFEINTKNTFSYAVVGYRDKYFGPNVTSILPFTADPGDAERFVKNLTLDNHPLADEGDAVYFGLKTALRQVGWGPNAKDETNIIIHIGGPGNHKRVDDTQVDHVDIISLLDKMNCQYYVFQGFKQPQATFNEFLDVNSNIMLTVAKRKYARYKNAPGSEDVSLNEPQFNEYENYRSLNNIAIAGKVEYLLNQNVVDPDDLQRDLNGIILFTNFYTDFLLKAMDRIMMDGQGISSALMSSQNASAATAVQYEQGAAKSSSAMVSSFAPAIMHFLSEMDLPEEKLDVIVDEHYQLYFPGYTRTQIDGLTYPLFNSVLFLTRKELSRMLIKFETLLNAISADEQRKKMVDAWVELLKKHTGGTDEEFMDLTMEEINTQVFGLPGTSEMLQVKLKNITDPAIVDDRTFQMYVGQVQRKQRALNKIFNKDNYEYSFSSNDQKYYWISEALLP